MCASCQCYVLNDVPLPEMGKMKKRCSQAFYVKSNSRLGCQIPITKILEGLELELAPEKSVTCKCDAFNHYCFLKLIINFVMSY
jgi:ferredoxin